MLRNAYETRLTKAKHNRVLLTFQYKALKGLKEPYYLTYSFPLYIH